jgi:hypothetical protein
VSGAADFVVTIHALERMEERFPDLIGGMDDRSLGEFIHGEVMDALEAGRQAKMAPLELAPHGMRRWVSAKKDSYVVWNEDKLRGYVMQDADEGLLVLTVLTGGDREEKRRKLLGGRRKSRA